MLLFILLYDSEIWVSQEKHKGRFNGGRMVYLGSLENKKFIVDVSDQYIEVAYHSERINENQTAKQRVCQKE